MKRLRKGCHGGSEESEVKGSDEESTPPPQEIALGNVAHDVTEDAYVPNPEHAWRPRLSQREMEVLCLIAVGKTDADIATALGITKMTASTHVKHILRKLGTGRRASAAALAIGQRIILHV
jgi:DNA-binding CsgD family transcriptional regulator